METLQTTNEIEVRKENHQFREQAREMALAINDDLSFRDAANFLVKIKERLKWWESKMAPAVKAAYDAHRKLTATVKEISTPLLDAESVLKPALASYQWEQEEKRRAEQARREKEERDRQEAARIEAAVEMEKAGMNKEAEQLIEAPIVAPMVAKAPAPTADGLSFQDKWTFEVSNFRELVQAVAQGHVPISALLPNETVIRQQVKSLKDQFTWPGVTIRNERQTNVRTGGF